MTAELSSAVHAALVAEAAAAGARECCGLLFGSGLRIDAYRPAPNLHPSPETHFEIDSLALIDAHRAARAGGPAVIGYYHSHPYGDAKPSPTDRAHSTGDGRIWAIVASGTVTLWRDEGDFKPLPYRLVTP